MKSITIIDYGMSNLLSISRALEYVGGKVKVSDKAEDILNADCVVLPGVGAFPDGMRELKQRHLPEAIYNFVKTGKPFLGICLGMQMMLSEGEEGQRTEGLNLIPGEVVSLPHAQMDGTKNKIPNVCWSEVTCRQEKQNTPFEHLPSDAFMYFVHSYFVKPSNTSHSFATTAFGDIDICCTIHHENMWGMQFHPEKSGKDGLELLRSFVNLDF